MNVALQTDVVAEINAWQILLNSRIEEAAIYFGEQKNLDSSEHVANITRNVFLRRNLDMFLSVLSFLKVRIGDDPENAQMYLCQLRTLADVMSKILYVLSLDEEVAARIIICDDSINLGKIDKDIYSSYYKSMIEGNPLFDSVEAFPSQNSLTRTKLLKVQKMNNITLVFPTFENRLDSEYINSKTFNISRKFDVSLKKNLLHAHTGFSHHVHGNHFFKIPQGNEIFWLSMYCLTLVSYLCEILDGELLNKELAADIRKQTSSTLVIRTQLVSEWDSST